MVAIEWETRYGLITNHPSFIHYWITFFFNDINEIIFFFFVHYWILFFWHRYRRLFRSLGILRGRETNKWITSNYQCFFLWSQFNGRRGMHIHHNESPKLYALLNYSFFNDFFYMCSFLQYLKLLTYTTINNSNFQLVQDVWRVHQYIWFSPRI